jgi:hypothetical protein
MIPGYKTLSSAQARNLVGGASSGSVAGAPLPILNRYDTAISEITIEHSFISPYVTVIIYSLDGYVQPPDLIKSTKVGTTNGTNWIRIILNDPIACIIRISQ